MKAVITEDEPMAAAALEELLSQVAPDIEVVARLQSVEDSVDWFGTHPAPDLVFMDIHLADGPSFGIFEQADISCPVIFTTAYDQYALKAFEVNSIDYLLKPIEKERLARAVSKLRERRSSPEASEINAGLVAKLIAGMRQEAGYKNALLIPSADRLVPLPVKSIAYVYTSDKMVRAVCYDGREMPLEQTLEELYALLDPNQFFRANRQYIVSRGAIKDVSIWFNGRLSVNLTVRTPERILVSRLNSKEFKEWITA